jgi:nicotinamidase/pyrazinamidase
MKINKEKSVSFLVDAQCGFTPLCPDELPVPDGDKIVEECLKTFEKTKYKIASKDAHPNNGDWRTNDISKIATRIEPTMNQSDLYWPRHCEVGTYGFDLIPGLPPIDEFDFIVYKGVERYIHPYSAVYHLLNPNNKGDRISTGVIEFLKSRNIDTIIILGLATNYCCMATAIDLKNAGFNVIVNLGGCRGIGDINPSIEKMKNFGIEFVESSLQLTN